ncbi:MAG: murein hydrolase activator EnvC family protein [Acutalibacteraceae bacterium]
MKRKIISFLLCVSLTVSCLVFSCPPLSARAATKSELEAQIEEYNAKIEANKKKLEELKNQKEKQQEYLETLEKQIADTKAKAQAYQTEINLIDGEIDALNAKLKQISNEISIINEKITATKKTIAETQQDIDDSAESMSARLRAAYMKGSESTLKILMGADSLAGFMTRLEMIKRTSEKDKETIKAFEAKVKKLEAEKKALEESKTELTAKKTEQEQKKTELVEKKTELKKRKQEHDNVRAALEKNYAEIESYVSSLDKSSSAYKNYISQLENEKKQANAEIDRIISQYYATSQKPSTTNGASGTNTGNGGGSYNTGESWAWPLGTRWCYISSKYGYRDASISGWSFHGGIDIAGGNGQLYGAPVYATRSGRVITAVTSDSGYGIYVIIDHGDGYSSLYGHMSVRYVSTGDSVSKGQMIGRVGDTGNSKGAHLHFEVRYYGEKKNPLNYVKNPNG